MNYATWKSSVNNFVANDAVIKSATVGVTIYNAARNLCSDAIESGQIVRRWWESHKEAFYAVLVLTALALVVVSVLTYAAIRGAIKLARCAATVAEECLSLDGTMCPCVGGPTGWTKVPQVPALDVDTHVFTAWAFNKFGRKVGGYDQAEVLAWAESLVA